jgi:tryptophan halogenase
MEVPDTLAERIAMFSQQAEAWQGADDLFRVDSWAQVMLGQRLTPQGWHRMAALMSEGRLKKALEDLQARIAATVEKLPPHGEFVKSYCGID